MSHIDYEPDPTFSPQGRPVTPYVIQDLRDKTRYGIAKYKRPLMTHDSRGLADAYQELIDGASYIKKILLEEDDRAGIIQELEPDLFEYAAHLQSLAELEHLRNDNGHLRHLLRQLLRPEVAPLDREAAITALSDHWLATHPLSAEEA